MKISALIASVVLGISGVAAAAPTTAFQHTNAAPVTVAYRPIQRPQRPQMQRWTVLDSHSGRSGRNVINVDSDQRFTQLQIKATQGSVAIDKVLVTFANGRTQTIDLSERITAGDRGTKIDLNGNMRQITKIVVVAKGRARSSYQVLAV